MRPRISISQSVSPSVHPERVFFNEPIMRENGRKRLGKQSKCSKVQTRPKDFQIVPKCPKMSQNVQLKHIVVRMDLFLWRESARNALKAS